MGFDPSQLSGLTGWIAARKETSFADGDPVGTATNFGSAANLTASGANRPTYKKAGYGGQSWFDFASSGPGEMAGSAASNYLSATAWSMFIVIDPVTIAGAHGVGNWWLNDLVVGDNGGFVGVTLDSSAGVMTMAYDGTNNTAAPKAISTGAWHIVHARHDSGFVFVSVDEGAEAGATATTTTSLTNLLKVGRSSTYNNPLTARVAEILIGNVVWVAADRASTYAFLRGVYAPVPRSLMIPQAVQRAAVR